MKFLSFLLLVPSLAFAVPGVIDPTIDSSNLKTTVCKPYYTAMARPPVSYTNRLKAMFLGDETAARDCITKKRGAGETWRDAVRECAKVVKQDASKSGDFELNHKIPLAVGGHPYDINNLELQPEALAKQEDVREKAAQRDLCAGRATLDQARARFAGEK